MRTFQTMLSGIGLRSPHYQTVLEIQPRVGWLEVHPENYFCGGMHTHMLGRIREHYPVSFHAVGLSLGSAAPVSQDHVRQLKALVERFDPVRVSDHASWSKSGNAHLGDLLPLPYNEESLSALCRNIQIVQDALGRRILIENPSTYLAFTTSTMSEPEFLTQTCRRTGCGLLLDVNNVFVQAHNHEFDAFAYFDGLPIDEVQEIHLAGHMERQFEHGKLLVDTHDQLVKNDVWTLYAAAIARFGAVPTLIEWDKDIPALDVLVAEAHRAESIMAGEVSREAA